MNGEGKREVMKGIQNDFSNENIKISEVLALTI
jgi:hypothetical protein